MSVVDSIATAVPATEEIWKDIPGYEGLYQVSNFGRVRYLDRPIRRGSGIFMRPGGIMKLGKAVPTVPGTNPYLMVNLTDTSHITKTHKVHVLVLTAFVGPRPKGHDARHFPDRDPFNNRLDNLLWGTRKQNMADAIIHGTTRHPGKVHKGEKHGMSLITDATVRLIRSMRGEKATVIGRALGINHWIVRRVLNGENWAHVRDDDTASLAGSAEAHAPSQ